MRARGVVDFPDPVAHPPAPGSAPPGKMTYLGDSFNPSSPTYQAASAACRKYAVAEPVTPAGAAKVQAEQLKYARCVRAHGEPNFPDPSANGGFAIPNSIDDDSPTFKAAERACTKLQPRLPGLPDSSGS